MRMNLDGFGLASFVLIADPGPIDFPIGTLLYVSFGYIDQTSGYSMTQYETNILLSDLDWIHLWF